MRLETWLPHPLRGMAMERADAYAQAEGQRQALAVLDVVFGPGWADRPGSLPSYDRADMENRALAARTLILAGKFKEAE